MVITYHGGAFIKVSFGDTTIAINPVSKESSLKGARFGADIALVSLHHPDFNGIDQVSHGDKVPFVIDGPGEYETKKIFIKGVPSVSKYGGEEYLNTMYVVTLEGVRLCFLGALGTRKLTADIKEEFGDIDVLFVPIGGKDVLNAGDAHELGVFFEPHIIIPLLYQDEKTLKIFLILP